MGALPLLLAILMSSASAAQQQVNYTVAFDLESPINFTAASSLFPNPTQTKNYVFKNFPNIPLFASSREQQKALGRLHEWNTLFTIGTQSYFGMKFTNSKVNVTNVDKNKQTHMNYFPVFNFPMVLQAKIIEAVFAKIRDSNELNPRILLVLNSSTANPDRPWEDIEILNGLLKRVSGVLKFMYYQNDSVNIVSTIRDTSVKYVILMVNANATMEILQEANVRGLLKWRYRWLIYHMVASSIDVKNSGLEAHSDYITIIQFGDIMKNDSVYAKTPMECVILDSVEILNAVTKYLFSSSSTDEVLIAGKTGDFKFDPKNLKNHEGMNAVVRTSWVMQIFRRLGSTSRIVGNITGVLNATNPEINVTIESYPAAVDVTDPAVLKRLSKTPLRIITVLEPPFVQAKANFKGPFSKENAADQLDGIVIEIGKAMLKKLNVSYTIRLDPSGAYGAKQANGWTGMIGHILDGQSDIAMAAFGINEDRKTVVDFLTSYMSFKGALLLKEKSENDISAMFSFLRPFDLKIWGMLIGSTVFVSIVLSILHCISPNKTNYNIYESFFFSLGSVFQGVTTDPPDKPSGRIVVCCWWFFSLIMVITYIANYGAYRTKARIEGEITSLNNLLTQNHYTYGTVQDSSYDAAFATSTFEYMRKINKMIRQEFKNGLVKNSAEGLELAKQGKYAFIWDNTITKYLAYQHCLKSTAEFDQFQYAFIVPKEAEFKPLMDKTIVKLKADGVITKILEKYPFIKGTGVHEKCKYVGVLGQVRKYIPKDLFTYASTDSLKLDQTLGIFAIMIAGCIISVFLAVIECSCRFCFRKYSEHQLMKAKIAKRKMESYA